MKNQTTAKDLGAEARNGEAASTGAGAYPEPLASFVARVEAMKEYLEGKSLAHSVADALGMLLEEPGWLLPKHRLGWPGRFRQHILHVAPDGAFSVVAVVWQPGQTTPIHDHVSWCVVGVYEGEEEETRYHLYEGAEGRFLVRDGVETSEPGQVTTLIPPEEDIHRVTNVGAGTAISIHVYGADIGKLGSSINQVFDNLPLMPDPSDAHRVAWRL